MAANEQIDVDDAIAFCGLLLVVALTWIGVFGFGPWLSFAGGDTVSLLPWIQQLIDAGDWHDVVVSPLALGGSLGTPIVVAMPAWRAAPLLGLDAVDASNLTFLVLQALLGFCFARVAIDVALGLSGSPSPDRGVRLAQRTLAGLAFAFLPVVAARIGTGHWNLLAGAVGGGGVCVIAVAACVGRARPVVCVIAGVALVHAFSAPSAQILVAGAWFVGPLLLAFAWCCADRRRVVTGLALVAALTLVGILFNLELVTTALRATTTTDTPRGLDAEVLIWSLPPRGASDWLESFFLHRELVPPAGLYPHETLYSSAPVVLAISLLFICRFSANSRWKISAWFVVVFLLTAVAAGNVKPVADLFLALPMFAVFRLPERALWAVDLFGAAVVVGLLLAVPVGLRWGCGVLVAAAAAAVAGPGPLEAVLWLGTLATAVRSRWDVVDNKLGRVAVIGVWTIAALSASRPWLGLKEAKIGFAAAQALGDAVRAAHPLPPLTRVDLRFAIEPFGPNSALAARLPGIEGYANPPRRFGQLNSALEKTEYQSTRGNYGFTDDPRVDDVIRMLYNVRWHVDLSADGELLFAELPTAGPAWLPQRIEVVRGVEASAVRVAALAQAGPAALQAFVVVDADDVAVVPILPPDCEGEVGAPTELSNGFAIPVRAPEGCLVVIAQNHLEHVRFDAVTVAGDRVALAAVPVDVALTAVVLPASTARIEAHHGAAATTWSWLGPLLAALLLTASAVASRPARGPL